MNKKQYNKKRTPNDKKISFHKVIKNKNEKKRIDKKLFFLEKKFTKELDETHIALISALPDLLQKEANISAKHFAQIKNTVSDLFKQLTSERNTRYANYLNSDAFVFAYAYYYLPWNCYKMTKLFLHLSIAELIAKKNKRCGAEHRDDALVFADFGSGPLTVPIALWIAEPKLRAKKITWYCFDLSNKILDLGEKIFHELERRNKKNAGNWTIKKVQSAFGAKSTEQFLNEHQRIDFYFSCNMFNEFINQNAENFANETYRSVETIRKYLAEDAYALIVEPGNPQGGKIITSMRSHFLEKNFSVLSPCVHCGVCPLDEEAAVCSRGNKSFSKNNFTFARGKWCHFMVTAKEQIESLQTISEQVKLPKEKLVFSYLLAAQKDTIPASQSENIFRVIITSELIKLRNGCAGRYACSEYGFLLLKSESPQFLRGLHSGDRIMLDKKLLRGFAQDKKTGARIIEM